MHCAAGALAESPLVRRRHRWTKRAMPNTPRKTVRLVGAGALQCACASIRTICAGIWARGVERQRAFHGNRRYARHRLQALKRCPRQRGVGDQGRPFEAILAAEPRIPRHPLRIAYAVLGDRFLRTGKTAQCMLKGTLPGGRAGRGFACSIRAADAGTREASSRIL